MSADGAFSPVGAGEKGVASVVAVGPGSNTGQKGGAALVDYVTLVLPMARLEECGQTRLDLLLRNIFGIGHELRVTALRDKAWQFYQQSAAIVDRDGELVGRVGVGGNRETVCFSLSGAGCKWVRNWDYVAQRAATYHGRLSRVDVAFDDYDGAVLNVHAMRERALAGDFAEGGRPPRCRFLSDEGHGTGSTLYVGGKGHKELCIYEKGAQLGMPESKWVRAEVRLYGKHTEIPLDVLRDPGRYLRGAYSVLGEVLRGVCSRLATVRKSVEVTGEALVRYLRRQVGPSLDLLRRTFGPEWAAFAESRVLREGLPGRFRGIASADQLPQLMREQLCHASP